MLLKPNWPALGPFADFTADKAVQLSANAATGKLSAGTGDDVLWYEPGYERIDGGPGNDTLRVAISGTTLDLTGRKWLFNVENIDLTPAGGSSIVMLDWHEIMRLTSSPHALHILGMAGDSVYAGSGWTYGGIVAHTGQFYASYTQNAATLLVDTDVRRSGIVDHAPDAEADRAITVAEDSAATPLGIAAPTELDGDALAITVTAVPNAAIGSVYLSASGGVAVTAGQSLTVAQLQGLVFAPVHDAYGNAGSFTYTVADQATALGLGDAQSIALAVTPVNRVPALTAFGVPDPAFGASGVVTTPFSVEDIATQADGKIIVAGTSTGFRDFALARYNVDGTLDHTFSADGWLTTSIGPSYDFGTAAAVQPDGKILLAGITAAGEYYDFALARYNADGSLDVSFGADGKVITPVGAWNEALTSLLLQPDGHIIAAGAVNRAPTGFVESFALVRYTPDGQLDATFGNEGIVTTALGGYGDRIGALALQSDGRIVAAGTTNMTSTGDPDLVLTRYNADGTVDSSFGANGVVTADVGPTASHDPSLAIQSDGKIVVGKTVFSGSDTMHDMMVARYDASGNPDTTFGNGGVVYTSIAQGAATDALVEILLEPDGDIVAVAGSAPNAHELAFAAARYHGDGTLDSSFNGGGTWIWQDGPHVLTASGALQPDGGVLIGGGTTGLPGVLTRLAAGAVPDLAVQSGAEWRLQLPANLFTDPDGDALQYSAALSGGAALPSWLTFDAVSRTFSGTPQAGDTGQLAITLTATDLHQASASDEFQVTVLSGNHAPTLTRAGLLDTTFGGDGIVTTPIGTNNESIAEMALQPDGKIVAVGTSNYGYFDQGTVFSVVRYNGDGSLDTTFSGDGRLITQIGMRYEGASGVALQPDGGIVAAGASTYAQFYVAVTRYTGSGALDTSFSGDGVFVWPYGIGSAVAVQPDGKLVVGGYGPGNGYDYLLMRMNPDGTLDNTFHYDGVVTTAVTSGADGATSMVLQPDGHIVLAGNSGSHIALVRYNSNGSLDTSFDGDGIVSSSWGGSTDAMAGLALQPDGKLLAAGYTVTDGNYDFAVARYNADGSSDATFGAEGVVKLAFGSSSDLGYGVAVQADGKVVVVGQTYSGTASDQDVAIARLNADGTLDTSFDGDGKLVIATSARMDGAGSVLVQPDGSIVVGGSSNNGSNADYLVLRILSGALPDQVAQQGDPFQLVVPEHLFTDPDGDALQYSASLANGDALPNWLTFDSAMREFTGTPAATDALDIRVTATDPGGMEASDVFRLAINSGSDWIL